MQGRVIDVWLTWLAGGICGVVILLVLICYCRLMPRHHKSFDEQYLKETYTIKSNPEHKKRDSYKLVKQAEVHTHYTSRRPASYAGDRERDRDRDRDRERDREKDRGRGRDRDEESRGCSSSASSSSRREHRCHHHRDHRDHVVQYASSSMLDEIEGAASLDALKTRSLPAFLRPKQRPLSTEDDLEQLYAKVSLSKKYKNRMRNDHAAIIALTKSHSQFLDSDVVIVYDQRTAL